MAPEVSDKILEYIKKDLRKAFGIQGNEKIPEYRISNVTNNEFKEGIDVEIRFLPNQLCGGYSLIKEEVIYRIHISDDVI